MPEITYAIVNITPAWALQKLRSSGYMLTPKPQQDVVVLQGKIESGNWHLNGDAIVSDTNDKIIDGFKRLHACVLANKSIKSVLVENVDRDSRLTIGAHRPRRNSDFLKVMGVNSHSTVSTMINAVHCMTNGVYTRRNPLKAQAAISTYRRYSDRFDSAIDFLKSGDEWAADDYIVATFHALLASVNPIVAEDFLRKAFLREDKGEINRDPALLLYRRLIENQQLSITLKREELFALIVKAWNFHLANEKISKLKWGSGQGEPFPKIAGWTAPHDIDTRASSDDAGTAHVEIDDDISVDLEVVEPHTAAEYLKLNRDNNRNRVASTVTKYARDMANGSWQLNGQSIKFDKDGQLFDGQHRLEAGVRSQTPFASIVVRNVNNFAFATYDDRKSKTFAAHLSEQDVKYATHLQTLISRSIKWDNGNINSGSEPTLIEMDCYFRQNPELKEFIGNPTATLIREPEKRGGAKVFKPSAATFALWTLIRINSALAIDFFEKLITGSMDPSADRQIGTLRNHRFTKLSEKTKKQANVRREEAIEINSIFRTWDAWLGGYDIDPRSDFDLRNDKIDEPRRDLI